MFVSRKMSFFLGFAREKVVVVRMMDEDIELSVIIKRSSVIANVGLELQVVLKDDVVLEKSLVGTLFGVSRN